MAQPIVQRKKRRDISGILLLDKPLGLSSNKALQKVKYLFQAQKAGHTGSLDPLATGVLPICLGEATKFSQHLLNADKVYQTRVKLGQKSATGDAEGDIIERSPVDFSFETMVGILSEFVGEISQTPSMFSAIKQNGQPLYKLARKGIEVERKARDIFIHELRLTSNRKLFDQSQEIDLYVHCSKGTYIRNLAEDIGEAAGCGAHLLSLRRLKAGIFEDMYSFESLEADHDLSHPESLDRYLLPVDALLAHFPELTIDKEQTTEIKFGRPLIQPKNPENVSGTLRLYCAEASHELPREFLGLAELNENGVLQGKRLLRTN